MKNLIPSIIFLITVISCRKDGTQTTKINNNSPVSTNCVKVVHPVWAEEITELDQIFNDKKTYDGGVLKAFIKNMCPDTVIIHLSNVGLHVGDARWYLNDGEGLFETIDDLTTQKIALGPYDSVYMDIAQFNLYRADYIDSIQLIVHIDKRNGDYLETINIYKEDFYNRSLLFSQYYQIILFNHRKGTIVE